MFYSLYLLFKMFDREKKKVRSERDVFIRRLRKRIKEGKGLRHAIHIYKVSVIPKSL